MTEIIVILSIFLILCIATIIYGFKFFIKRFDKKDETINKLNEDLEKEKRINRETQKELEEVVSENEQIKEKLEEDIIPELEKRQSYVIKMNEMITERVLPSLEEMYSYSDILSRRPVFIDSPDVRSWVDLIKKSLDSFSQIYIDLEKILDSSENFEEDEKDEENEETKEDNNGDSN